MLTLALLALAASCAVLALTAVASRMLGRYSVVDVAWGLAFLAMAVTVAVAGEGDAARRWLLLALVAVWSLRLAWHIGRRQRGHGEDPRYERLLRGSGFGTALWKVFGLQALLAWLVAWPLVVGAAEPVRWWPVVWLGVAVWAVGLAFEVVGDAQLATYRSTPRDQRPPVLDTGLWAWTRHPNYFGDAVVWWGIWLVGALASGWLVGVATVASPLLMTHLLRNVSGAKLLERSMRRRSGWTEYAARVPLFVPRRPRLRPKV